MPCSQCCGIETQFNRKLAAQELRKYRKGGPRKTTQMMVDALEAEGVTGQRVLDIGGGIGAVQHALLKAGVEHVTGVDASTAYLEAAAEEVERQGYTDRVAHRYGDFVEQAATVKPVDVVTLDRVICCYPDMQALVGLSAERAGRLYGVVYPRRTWWTRVGFKLINMIQRLRKSSFHVFLHAPEAVDALIRSQGLTQRFYGTTFLWQVVVYGRE